MKEKLINIGLYLLITFMLYASVSGIRYRFANPKMTQTECIIHFVDMLKWK